MEDKLYTVSWASDPSGDPDQHGNRWQNLKLEGHEGYTVRILAKNPINKGSRLYGHVEKAQKRSKPGEFYYRFRRQPMPDGMQTSASTSSYTVNSSQDELLKLVKEIHHVVVGEAQVNQPEFLPTDDEVDNVDLSDIPF